MSVFFAAALLFDCQALSAASPMTKTEDSGLEQDLEQAFSSLLMDQAADNSLADADLMAASKAGGPKVIVVADPYLWRAGRVPHNGLSFFKRRAEDSSQVTEQRDVGQDLSLPILRRDTMRCMVGRVYRPCWEV